MNDFLEKFKRNIQDTAFAAFVAFIGVILLMVLSWIIAGFI